MAIVMAAVGVEEDMDTHMGAVVPKMQKMVMVMVMARKAGMPMKLPTRRTST